MYSAYPLNPQHSIVIFIPIQTIAVPVIYPSNVLVSNFHRCQINVVYTKYHPKTKAFESIRLHISSILSEYSHPSAGVRLSRIIGEKSHHPHTLCTLYSPLLLSFVHLSHTALPNMIPIRILKNISFKISSKSSFNSQKTLPWY